MTSGRRRATVCHMSTKSHATRRPTTQRTTPYDDRPWAAAGVAVFSAVMLVMVGAVQALQGLVALLDDDFFVRVRNYTYSVDVTGWGWVHLVIGLVAVATGLALFTGQWWARIVGITLASLSLVSNFLWLPYYPVWALLIIAMNVLIIWGISTFDGDDLAHD